MFYNLQSTVSGCLSIVTFLFSRFYPVRQRLSFHQFQDKEVGSAGLLQPMNGGNVGMV